MGISTPPVNLAWGLTNLVASYLLFRAARLSVGNPRLVVCFFTGGAAIGFALSIEFQKKTGTQVSAPLLLTSSFTLNLLPYGPASSLPN